jgi:hypothetical protein
MDASQHVAQRATRSDAHIVLENVVRVNARTLLHPNRQQEMRNANRHAHQGQREQLLEERRQEIRNADRKARSAQRELNRVNHPSDPFGTS